MAKLRFLCLILMVGVPLFAQQRAMTTAQLMEFVRSSIGQKMADQQVADYIKSRVKLTQKLDARSVEELQGLGAGLRTVAALKTLSAASAALPEPPPVEAPAPRAVIPPPSREEQERVLRETTEYARSYTKNLPNFLCIQLTRRRVDSTGMEVYGLVDTIQERLSYNDHKEDYQVVMVNNRAVTNVKHEQLGGAISSGEFGSMLDEIFDPASNASFQWERWGTLRGKRMHVFSFRVPQATSKYSIFHGGTKRTIVAGYHGYIYVDRDLGFVAKIAMECDSIPVDFPVQTVKLDLDYDFTKIGTQDFVLPLKTSLKSREGKYLSWNEAEFRLYKKFGTETTVTFEPLEPLSEDATKEQPPVPDTKK